MSSKFNLDVIGEIADKNNSIENIKPETKIQDITNIEQATIFIKENDSKATLAWFNMSHVLKKVRDEKLYKDNYDTFEDYFENVLQYKKSMVYKFIKIAETFPINTSNNILNCGVTKLISLIGLTEEQRTEFLEDNNISKISVSELKKKIKEKKTINIENYNKIFKISQEEQITLLDLNINLIEFQNITEEVSLSTNNDDLSHQQVIRLNQLLEKTKKEMKKLDKMIKKYI